MKKIIFLAITLSFIVNIFFANDLREWGYEVGHYIKTGQKIEAQYVYFYIIESDGELMEGN